MENKIKEFIQHGILAKPKIPFETLPLSAQTSILKNKYRYDGKYIYETYSHKVLAIDDSGTVREYIGTTLKNEYKNILI